MEEHNLRVVPVLVDETALPPLLRPLKYLEIEDGIPRVVDAIMGFSNDRDRLRAVQEVLDEAGIELKHFCGRGPMVGCPRCGAAIGAESR